MVVSLISFFFFRLWVNCRARPTVRRLGTHVFARQRKTHVDDDYKGQQGPFTGPRAQTKRQARKKHAVFQLILGHLIIIIAPTPRIASPMDLERVGEVAGRVGRL